MFKKTVFIFFVVFFLAAQARPAYDTKGDDFWIAFPGSYNPKVDLHLYITSETDTSGTARTLSPFSSSDFTVSAGDVTVIQLQDTVSITNNDSREFKGINITAEDPVTVYAMSRDTVKTDAFLAIPVDSLGTEYIVQSYKNTPIEVSDGGTEFAVVGTEDGTNVTVTLSEDTLGHFAGVPYGFTLNEGEVYYLYNTVTAHPADLSGSFVSADRRVAVIGAHRCANVPSGELYCDYIAEQLPPITSWGKEFIITPLAGRTGGDTYRFMASENNTVIYLDGVSITASPLNKGDFYEAIIDGAGHITTTGRVLAVQYAHSTDYDGETGDPFMMIVPPVEQYLEKYTVYTPQLGFSGNYLNLVVNNADAGSVSVDGVFIDASNYTTIGASGYSAARLSVGEGPHNIEGSLPLLTGVYGFNFTESYGYPGGSGALDFVSTPTPTVTKTITKTRTLTVTVTPTITLTEHFTSTSTVTATPEVSPTATATATATATVSMTFTASFTYTISYTATPEFSATKTFTLSFTRTITPTPQNSPTLSFTPALTPLLSRTFTPTVSFTPANSPVLTPSLTAARTATLTITFTPPFPSPTFTLTFTPTPPYQPLSLCLKGNYPNPAKKRGTNIVFHITAPAEVTVKIFDVSGELVHASGVFYKPAGYNTYFWDGRNKSNRVAASGVYIYKIKVSNNEVTRAATGKFAAVR